MVVPTEGAGRRIALASGGIDAPGPVGRRGTIDVGATVTGADVTGATVVVPAADPGTEVDVVLGIDVVVVVVVVVGTTGWVVVLALAGSAVRPDDRVVDFFGGDFFVDLGFTVVGVLACGFVTECTGPTNAGTAEAGTPIANATKTAETTNVAKRRLLGLDTRYARSGLALCTHPGYAVFSFECTGPQHFRRSKTFATMLIVNFVTYGWKERRIGLLPSHRIASLIGQQRAGISRCCTSKITLLPGRHHAVGPGVLIPAPTTPASAGIALAERFTDEHRN